MKAQPADNCDRLRQGDEPATHLGGIWTITKNEVHALKYGTIGLFIGAYSHIAFETSLTLSITLFLVAFGLRRVRQDRCKRSIAVLTVRHEPHWFTLSYLVSYGVGYVLVPIA